MSHAKLKSLIPITPAGDDVDAVIAFYETALGFTLQFKTGDPTDMAIIQRDDIRMMLQRNTDQHLANQTAFRIEVSRIALLYAECIARGGKAIHPNGKLQDKPWGSREFSIIDPAGVCITFFEFA